jgi:hypothetical protein
LDLGADFICGIPVLSVREYSVLINIVEPFVQPPHVALDFLQASLTISAPRQGEAQVRASPCCLRGERPPVQNVPTGAAHLKLQTESLITGIGGEPRLSNFMRNLSPEACHRDSSITHERVTLNSSLDMD